MRNPTLQAPFLDVRSLVAEETDQGQDTQEIRAAAVSPFISLYENNEAGRPIDPENEEYTSFLNDLYEPELDEALSELAGEASALSESLTPQDWGDPVAANNEAERRLEASFDPLARESMACWRQWIGSTESVTWPVCRRARSKRSSMPTGPRPR